MKENMEEIKKFELERKENIERQGKDELLLKARESFFNKSFSHKYSYNFEFLGRPIIQYPQDMVAIQELIWSVKPDLIIETGIAHGGSLIMSASMLALLDICDALEAGKELINPKESKRKVVGIDIDIREHNRKAIEDHPMASRIEMIQGSSIALDIINRITSIAKNYNKIMVCLDSNHTHDHVLAELNAFAPLTTVGSYCIVFDTIVDDMPNEVFSDRPWGLKNNPKTAVKEYLSNNNNFQIDRAIDNKLLISVAPSGYLKRVK
jgi:cephalosporin hydroxylase